MFTPEIARTIAGAVAGLLFAAAAILFFYLLSRADPDMSIRSRLSWVMLFCMLDAILVLAVMKIAIPRALTFGFLLVLAPVMAQTVPRKPVQLIKNRVTSSGEEAQSDLNEDDQEWEQPDGDNAEP